MRRTSFCRFLVLFCCIALVSCNADPWPEPDPAPVAGEDENSNPTGDMEPDDSRGDNQKDVIEGDAGAPNTDDTNYTPGQGTWGELSESIYCSAPNADGDVTVVGLPGVASLADVVKVISNFNLAMEIIPGEDGSFASRLPAVPGEELTFTLVGERTSDMDELKTAVITVSETEVEATQPLLMGDRELDVPDADGLLAIHGQGDLLKAGYLVFAGNIDLSHAMDTRVTCTSDCRFDMFLPGETGDEIDLFLVPADRQAGNSNAVTLEVP